MCSPTMLLIAGTAVTGTSQAISAINAGRIGKANAAIQRRLAEDARERGAADEESQRRQTAAFKGEQAARFGASGAEINSGSSLNILADTAQLGELDALRVRNNAEREAFALEAGAAISEAEGSAARTTGLLNAGGTLLTGGGIVAGKWKAFNADNKTKKPGAGGTFTQFLGT